MTSKYYHIYRSLSESFDKALEEVLSAIATQQDTTIRILFFGAPSHNEQFEEQRTKIEVATQKLFPNKPMTAYIAQAPLCSQLVAEVTSVSGEEVESIEYHDDYIVLNHSEIISGGIYANNQLEVDQQSEIIFSRVNDILHAEGVEINDIVRQWNYIEQITHIGERGQHYQLFNDVRSRFYDAAEWSNGYPAATGIGTQLGGVTVLFDAVRESVNISKPIDNPLQISAHAYSQQVLINTTDKHKTTPKFERARHIDGKQPMIHISGTAAIRGEESCMQDIIGQTALTMENIDYLISRENQLSSGVKQPAEMEYAIMRVYIKHRENLNDVVCWIHDNYPTASAIYVWADICRDELLIEIEGVAKKIN